MISWLTQGASINYGQQLADGKIGELAHSVLFTCAIVALATAALRYSIDRQGRNPLVVIPWMLGLLLLLHLYGFFLSAIDGIMRDVADGIAENGAFAHFLDNWVNELGRRFSFDVAGSIQKVGDAGSQISQEDASTVDRIKGVWDTLGVAGSEAASFTTSFLRGALSGILAVLSAFVSIVFFEVFSVLRVTLFQVLYAVGPLVIAFSILPGASPILNRWFTAVFEISSWQVIGAIVFELVAKSSSAAAFKDNNDNFVAFCVANVVFAVSILLIPMIAHRIVGSGFGAVGQSVQHMVLAGAGAAASFAKPYAQKAMQTAANMAKPYVARGATAAADMVRARAQNGSLAADPGIRQTIASAPTDVRPEQAKQVVGSLLGLAAEQQARFDDHRAARREPIDAVAFSENRAGGSNPSSPKDATREPNSAERLFAQMRPAPKYMPPADQADSARSVPRRGSANNGDAT